MKKVITYGTFDVFHQGHYNLLKRAKALGDYLIVGVTSENYDHYRGKLNVKQSLLQRIENVKNSGFADEILVEEYEGQKIDDIKRLGVDIFTVGSDWVGKFDYLKEFCEVVYLERTKGISSTQVRTNSYPIVQFGIVGSGRIANRFITESKYVSGNTIEGVFGIREDSARAFALKHELSFYTTDYNELLEKVNAVYIASPHNTHYEYAKAAILRGKHVLCEKPMVLSKAHAEELFNLAREKKVVLCEALKTAYCPGFQRLISYAKSGKIGEIKCVDASFTKLVSSNCREMKHEFAGGSVTELASYPLLAIFKLLGDEYTNINFTSFHKNGSVDLFTKIDMTYKNAVATAKIGLGVKTEGSLVVSGTRGYIYVPAPWWKTEYFELKYENLNETEKNFYKFAGDGLRYEIMAFLNQIANGGLDEQNCACSIATAEVIDKFLNGTRTIIT